MTSLTSCMKKAGDSLNQEDKAKILTVAQGYRKEGMGAQEAAKLAVSEQITLVAGLLETAEAKMNAGTPAAPGEPAAAADAVTPAQKQSAAREMERSLFRELTSPPGMVGKSIPDLAAAISARVAGQPDLDQIDATRATQLARAIHKQIATNEKALEKSRHRQPEVYQAAVDGASEGITDPAARERFVAGFAHAMAGKTKSTLVGDMLADQIKGYMAAQAWIETEEGAAWYEGRPVNKLQNTGIDLRRHWEQLQAQMKAGESDIQKAWKQIERATARADLFAPLLPTGVSPGFQLYVTEVRSGVITFKDWLQERQDSWYGSSAYRSRRGSSSKSNIDYILSGSRYPSKLAAEDRKKFETDEAYRAQYLRDAAAEYLSQIKKMISFLDGKSSVKEAAEAFDDLYIDKEAVAARDGDKATKSNYSVLTKDAEKLASSYYGLWTKHHTDFAKLRSGSMWTETLIEKEATIALPKRSDALSPPKLDRVTREGLTDQRKGADITPADFKKTFGFADVGFGKWVGSKQDQDHLNYAYDSFMDLANHFGTSPKNIGFGGQLHFTIGALGRGKASAHFWASQPHPEGGTVSVINLTNTKGDGTVYHEWTHAIDHFMGGEWKSRVRPRLLKILRQKTETAADIEQIAKRFITGGSYFKGDKRASKVDAAIRGLQYYRSNGTMTAYKSNADKLGKDYWGNEEELIARAAEAWATDTLGGTNTYLVNPDWAGDGKATPEKGYRGTPYPTGAERKLFAEVYDALAKSVKWEGGKPTVSMADFEAALPDSVTAGERRRNDLMQKKNIEAFAEDLQRAQVERTMAAEDDKRAKEREEQAELDRIAAEKLAELETIDPPQPDQTAGPLAEDDISAIFDQAAAELREETQEQPDVPAPGEPPESVATAAKPAAEPDLPADVRERAEKLLAKTEAMANPPADKGAAALMAEAAKMGVKGADEALKGLSALFGKPGRLNSFPGGFDEETYQQAKPHFEAALVAFQAAGKSLKDLFKLLIQQFGDGVKEYAVRFAKDQNLTANLGSQPSASAAMAGTMATRLERGQETDWRRLFEIADFHFGGTQAEGKYTPKDAYDALEMGINKYLMSENGRAFNPDASPEAAKLTMAALDRVLTLVPTQTKRTAEQDEFQQFSTVPTLAYAANWVANINSADTMLEPSAGIGGLAAFAKNAGAKLVLNELSSRRAAVLQELFPSSKVWTENAEQLHNILPESVTPSVVVMNPPFSASAGRMQGQRDTQLGGQHVEQALMRLAPGGRLVAIVGEGMAMDKPAFKDWWAKIGAKYDVRAAIPMDGKGYAKYGTTFDNVLFVIDKAAPSGREVVTTKVTAYTELVDLLSEIRNDRPDARIPAQDRDGIESASAESARFDDLQAGEGDAGAGIAGPGGADLLGQGESGGGAAVDRNSGKRSGGGRKGRPAGNAVEPTGAADAGRQDTQGRVDDAAAPAVGSDDSGVTITSESAQAGVLTESVFESYTPQRLQVPGAKPHPGPLVQSAAMASVLPPAATYTPKLPAKTVKDGLLSIAQIEAVVYAGQAHGETLGSGERRGFFIGDGTGVGKGREIGGIILDNLMQGRKKAVWISEKQGLMIDAKRDFKGVGGDDTLIFNQNKTKAEDGLPEGDGILFTTYSTLRSGAQSQAGTDKAKKALLDSAYAKGSTHTFNLDNGAEVEVEIEKIDHKAQKFVVTNINTGRSGLSAPFAKVLKIGGVEDWQNPANPKAKKAGQSRLDQLVAWLGADYDGVIAFDEAHNAGNAVPMKGERGASEPSAQALAVVELQKKLPKARVVYVSATGATTVSNLSYATRLGLWGPGTPFASVQNFVAEMTAGGLATMELVARDMKQMGAYIARSLSFEGVSYSRVEHELTPLQREIYDRVAEGWQVTLQNIEKALEVTGGAKSRAAKGAAKSAYWGAQQRFFNQIITSMQMPAVIEQMETDIANGDALVLQLVNTNEDQQNRAIAKRKEDDESTDLEDLDLTPRDQLLQMVEKSFPVVQYEKYTDDNGKTHSRPVLDSDKNPVQNREAVQMRDRLLEDLKQIRVPDGPLEIILNHFGVDKVSEVTGRTRRVVRKPDAEGNMKAQLETRGPSAARADADSFLADKRQILLFSDAGGTGFSFHADLTKPNQRKRKHYLIQPGWRADKAVQGFGRTHRTNQKSAPHYYLASTNIPAQKRFLSAIARRLDQLGALTKGQRDASNQGMFSEKDNLESNFATQAVRQLIDDMKRGSISSLNFKDFLIQAGLEDIVSPETGQIAEDKYPTTRLFLNRMLSLKLDMQEKVFDAFIQRMEDKVEVAAQRGELDAGMETIRALESKVLADEVIYTDPRTDAKTRYVELELTQPTRFYDFPIAANESKDLQWVKNIKSGKVYAKIRSGDETLKTGALVERYRMRGTGGTQLKNELQVKVSGGDANHVEISEKEARELWAAENKAKPKTYTETTHMIVGAMLPIWDRMKTEGSIRVARTQTTDGQRLLGRVIAAKDVPEIRKRLNIESAASKLPPAEIMARILKGDTGELANGWTMVRAKVSDDLRIELKAGYLSEPAKRELTGMGVVPERIQWKERFFIPTGKAGVPVLEALFKTKPLVDLTNPKAAKAEDDDEPRFSRAAAGRPVAPVSRNPDKTPLYEALRQLSRFDDAFQIGTSQAQDLDKIASDMTAGKDVAEFKAEPSTELHQGNRKPTLALKIKNKAGDFVKILDIFESESETPFVVIGNSELGQYVGGAYAYQMAFTWAHNNGKRMVPDPAGLTVINRLRRTEAMISSAYRHGTTRHLEPHVDQYVAMTEKMQESKTEPEDLKEYSRPDLFAQVQLLKEKLWTNKSDPDSIASNVQHLIEASAQLAAFREPNLRRLEFVDGQLRQRGDVAGISLDDAGIDAADGKVKIRGVVLQPARSGVGSSTVQRYAVVASVGREINARKLQKPLSPENQDGGMARPGSVALSAIRKVLGDLSSGPSDGLKGAFYSRAQQPRQPALSQKSIEDIIAALKAQWKNAPEIVVAKTMNDTAIPQKVRDYNNAAQQSQGDLGTPEGFFYGGKVYMVADTMNTPADVLRVLFHESLGHAGLRGNFGDSLKPILQQIVAVRRAEVTAKAKEYGLDMSKEADRLQAAEEVLANMAQDRPELGFVKRAVAAIRTWLRANVPGFEKLDTSDAEIIRSYILPARGWIERGEKSQAGGLPVFSRKAQATDQTDTTSDQDNPDIRYSRATVLKTAAGRATDMLNDAFSHPGGLSFWDKTVGSMYHLAERQPTFKRVFNAAQNFINDVSFFATEAAELAPKILPRLETWRDLAKSPISAADSKAIAKPIMEGTLSWKRDADGKAVRVDEDDEGLAGVVWTDSELRSMFELTDGQIELYREFRAATDKSLDNMAKADLLRFLGKDAGDMRAMVMDAPDVGTAAKLLRQHLLMVAEEEPGRKDVLDESADEMDERVEKVEKLKEQGYAPLSRFGRYTVDVVVDGERQYFSLFDTKRAANQAAAKMREEFGESSVSQGVLSQREFEAFQGITPESLELFGNMLGLDSTGDEAQDKVFQTYLKLTKANRSAMKRLIHRKGVAGYSEDVGRVLAAFVYSNARQTSAALHLGELGEAVQKIPKSQGELKDAAIELSGYIKQPREEAQALRALMFAQYLGGSIASAFVNFTQPFTVSFPYLSQFGGAAASGKALAKAMADQREGVKLEDGLARALKIAEEQGVVAPQEVHQLMAQARGTATLKSGDGTQAGEVLAKANNAWVRLSLGWGKLFGMAEQINRRSTFIAAYRMAVDRKIADPGAFATKAVNETQFINNRANRAHWARGPVGATLMTFKSYSVNYLELLHRLSTQNGPEGKKAAALMLGMLLLVAGGGGLPFAEDLDDAIDMLAQRLGYSFSTKQAKRKFLEDLFGQAGAQFVESGITGLAGSPVDISGRMSMANLIPGTGLLIKKDDHSRDVVEVLGPVGDLIKRGFKSVDYLASGEFGKAALEASPRAVANAAKGVDMADTGMYRDARGRKVIETDAADAVVKAIGFQPQKVARVQEATRTVQILISQNKVREAAIAEKWAQGMFEKDQDKIDAARAALKDWNDKNPSSPIKIEFTQIIKRVRAMRMSKEDRMAKTAPQEIRNTVRAELVSQQ